MVCSAVTANQNETSSQLGPHHLPFPPVPLHSADKFKKLQNWLSQAMIYRLEGLSLGKFKSKSCRHYVCTPLGACAAAGLVYE